MIKKERKQVWSLFSGERRGRGGRSKRKGRRPLDIPTNGEAGGAKHRTGRATRKRPNRGEN